MFKKLFLCLLTLMMLCTVSACKSPGKDVDGTDLVKQTLSNDGVKTDVYRYTPANLDFKGGETPLIIVVGDSKFDDASAQATLNKGFKKIADEESCSVVFVSSQGNSWSQEDYAVLQMVAGWTSEVWTHDEDFSSGVDGDTLFYASHFRVYVFAEKNGCQFVKENLDNDQADYTVLQWGCNVGGFGAGFAYCEDGFTSDKVAAKWEEIRHTNRMYLTAGNSFLTDFVYWDEEGIKEPISSSPVLRGRTIQYRSYTTDKVKATSLLVCFQGHGSHPNTYMQQGLWPLFANEGYEVLSVYGPYDKDYSNVVSAELTDDTNEMLQAYAKEKGYETIFLTGFSMGAYRVADLIGKYPDNYTAGVIGDLVKNQGIVFTKAVPVIYLAGEEDFYGVFPGQNDWAADLIKNLGEANGFAYSYDSSVNNLWGYNFEKVTNYVDNESGSTVHYYQANDITYFADVTKMSHNVLPYCSQLIASFFKEVVNQ